jgi:hypothetical protein
MRDINENLSDGRVAGRCGRIAHGSPSLLQVRVTIDEQSVQVKLSPWERALGLMRDISVPLGDVSEVEVVQDPVREAMRSGMKVGLRLPWLMFVARTMRLDQVFVVRRGVPALSFAVRNHGALQRVLLSTPEADELARRLRSGIGV